jgi:hypothetical protein
VTAVYIALAIVTVAVWIPALLKFFRTWKARKNPISLAICTAILLIMWEAVGHIWEITGAVTSAAGMLAFTCLSIAVGIYFNLSFLWAKKRFPDVRGS